MLLKLECCQLWFLKNIFYLPSFAHSTLVLKISGLNSIESEIDVKRLLFLGRLITQPKMSVAVTTLFQSRTESFFDVNIISIGVVSCICEALQKYDLFDHFKAWFYDCIFPTYTEWKKIVRRKVRERQKGIWSDFCSSHPDLKVAQDCLNNVHPEYFWSLANQYPDLVKRLHTQVRLMCNFGFNGAFHGYLTPTVLIVLFASILLTIIVTSYLIVRASKTILPSYGIN